MIYIDTIRYRIPGRPVTKKNSQQMARNPKTGRLFPVPSKQYKTYEKAAKVALHPLLITPINSPVNVRVVYHLQLNKDGSLPKNLPDLTNLLEATDDILVKYKVIQDDNVSIVASHDGSRAIFTSEEPYTEVEISLWEGAFTPDQFEQL